MHRTVGPILVAVVLTAGIVAWAGAGIETAAHVSPRPAPVAAGYVFLDANGNGRRDSEERGLANVRVSNQSLIVKTDRNGRWEMPAEIDENTIYYVVKPRGYRTAVDANQVPRFYYVHKPKGSPPSKFPGVAPTGPLPASIDFPLYPQKEGNKFDALFFGDTQPRDLREADYVRRDIVEPIGRGHGASFGTTLGDIVFDDLSVLEPLSKIIGLMGTPWYNVPGNHDTNQDVDDDELSDETWERVFGPNYYSYDYGAVHFVVLDDIDWRRVGDRRTYRGALGEKQIAWIAKDLALVPDSQLVVYMMHIPIVEVVDREAFFRLIEKRPNTISVSAHTHYQEHIFLSIKHGWNGTYPHHHINNAATCGSWWQGAPDELGIPTATMRDGAPNGYSTFHFDGNRYSITYRVARRPAEYQMEIYAPESIEAAAAGGTEVLVNVFAGSARSKVEMRIDDGPWSEMVRGLRKDPVYAEEYERSKELKAPYRPLPAPIDSPHMWAAKLPAETAKGMRRIRVRTTDMFGQTYESAKGLVVR